MIKLSNFQLCSLSYYLLINYPDNLNYNVSGDFLMSSLNLVLITCDEYVIRNV
jgi:hypothetical protein